MGARLIDVNDEGSGPGPDGGMRMALSIAMMAAVAAAPAAAGPSVDRGRRLAEQNCAACHAVGPIGDSPNPASPPFRELHKRYPVENLAEAFVEGIVTGHPEMPQFRLTPRQTMDLIAYLKSLQRRQHASRRSSAATNASGAS